jgi:hypothetical protein
MGRADALESGGERGSRRSARGECPCDGEPRGRRGGGRRGRLARQRRHESVEALVGERRRERTASRVFGGGIASVGGELRFAGCGRWFDGGGGDDCTSSLARTGTGAPAAGKILFAGTRGQDRRHEAVRMARARARQAKRQKTMATGAGTRRG